MQGNTTRRDVMTAGLAAGVGGLAAAAISPSEALATTSGKTIISGEESRSSSSFGLLSTPDQVTGIDVPTNGKLRISYLAGWKADTTNATISAAIFIGSDQLRSPSDGTSSTTLDQASTDVTNSPNKYTSLRTSQSGLSSLAQILFGGATTFSGYPTTGVIISPLEAFVAAGTYTISVQFKVDTGAVLVKDRRLWVEAIAY